MKFMYGDGRDFFNPETFSASLWSLIEESEGNKDKLKRLLESLSPQQVKVFYKDFKLASVALTDDIFLQYTNESEDGIKDITHWVVSKGKIFYLKIWNNPELFPNSVEDRLSEILFGVVFEVLDEYD